MNKYFLKNNQIDITSSHLNEFWNGLKFEKAVNLLFRSSVTLPGRKSS